MAEGSAGAASPAWRSQPGRAVRTWLFGDRVGLAIFLAVVCFGGLVWRADLFLTDTATLVRTLEALGDGRLWLDTVDADGGHFAAPGTEVRDGRVYGRNYGQVVAALPALAVLTVLDAVANLRVALVAGWHLAALGLVAVVGPTVEREWPGAGPTIAKEDGPLPLGRPIGPGQILTVGGSLVVLCSFLVNAHLATQLPEPRTALLELLALQVTTLVAAGFLAVFLYRLVDLAESRRVALAAGLAGGLVLPIGLWATIPKRHVFSALACVAVLYLFARSRDGEQTRVPVVGAVPLHRAGAYAVVGMLTWIHAAEGLFLFLALVAVDLPTASDNDPRSLAVVVAIFALSLVPTLVTNLLVTGEFFRPPRALGGSGIAEPSLGGGDAGGGGGGGGSGGGGAGGGAGSGADAGGGSGGGAGDDGWLVDTLAAIPLVGAIGWLLAQVLGIVTDGLAALGDPERVFHTFVRSAGADLTGSREFRGNLDFAGTNLSVLEAAPLLAGAVAALAGWLGGTRLRPTLRRARSAGLRERVDPTVALALAICLAYVLVYLPRLPLYAQFTQRYLLPIFPLGLYVLARTPAVGGLIERTDRVAIWTYAAGVLLGGQLFVAAIVAQDLTASEGAQQFASLSLALAGALVLTTAGALISERFERPAAVSVGLAAAAGTVFVLVAGLSLFDGTGELVLPLVETIADLM